MIWASAKGVTVVTTSTRVQFTVEVTIYNVWVPGKEVKAANSNLEHNNHRVEQGDGRMIQQQTNTLLNTRKLGKRNTNKHMKFPMPRSLLSNKLGISK